MTNSFWFYYIYFNWDWFIDSRFWIFYFNI